MTRDTITCRYCGGLIGPHWQVFAHSRCQPGDLTPEQQREVEAMERRNLARMADLRVLGTGLVVRRADA
jgi:hypothetical protein